MPRGVYTLLEEKDAARSTHAAKPAPGRIACPQSRRPARRRAKLETPAIGACRAIRAAAALAGSLANTAAGQKWLRLAASSAAGKIALSAAVRSLAPALCAVAPAPWLVRSARSLAFALRAARSVSLRSLRRRQSCAHPRAASAPVARSPRRGFPQIPGAGAARRALSRRSCALRAGPKTAAVRAVSTSGRGPKGARAAPRQTTRHVA